ncbi:Flp family type IVb pilin [Stutzerimonas stutzeri]|uniref:Flp family type IVb pilin n=1 Tax=Stutzerimonas stutzeri TaxID=316 RepID=A0A2N8STK2_STUST|nr:Flp family type IVb pilin [Stutzerimonas stutzeri]MCQ4325822.1 Flp family type IVb pilin [Stutzerimonas stutzeri]PNG05821.1 Flp family type IVb pilin [Stutzerimonas stutzeri]
MQGKIISLYYRIQTFLRREEGASAIEYGIIAGLIAVAIITGAGLIGDNLADVFDRIQEALKLG